MAAPKRNRKIFAGDNTGNLLDDYFPHNSIEINGESFYSTELHAIARSLEHRKDIFYQVEAFLKAEPENPKDPNAVAIFVQEQKVGYVNKTQAPAFKNVLREAGGAAWVLTAMRYVSDISQFRLRIMAELPAKLDLRTLEFVDLSYLDAFAVWLEDIPSFDKEKLYWRIEEISPAEQMAFHGPVTALVDATLSDEDGSTIRILFSGGNSIVIDAQDQEVLSAAVREVGGKAWVSIRLVDTFDGGLTIFFTPKESKPSIMSLDPNNEWWKISDEMNEVLLDWENADPPEFDIPGY